MGFGNHKLRSSFSSAPTFTISPSPSSPSFFLFPVSSPLHPNFAKFPLQSNVASASVPADFSHVSKFLISFSFVSASKLTAIT